MTYIFEKSGSHVCIIEPQTVTLNGEKLNGFTVMRLDTGKKFFAPEGSLTPVNVVRLRLKDELETIVEGLETKALDILVQYATKLKAAYDGTAPREE